MIFDNQNLFDYQAAITSTRNSTNVIDLIKTAQNIGVGNELYVDLTVVEAFTAGGSATLQIAVVTDDNAALSSPTTLQDQPAVIPVASLVLGLRMPIRVHPAAFERYLGLVYTVATGPMTAGKVTAGLVLSPGGIWVANPKNYPTA